MVGQEVLLLFYHVPLSYGHVVHILDSLTYIVYELANTAEHLSVDSQAIISVKAVHDEVQLFLAGWCSFMSELKLLLKVFLNRPVHDRFLLLRGGLPMFVLVRPQVLLYVCLLQISAFAEQRVRGVDQVSLANAFKLACSKLL